MSENNSSLTYAVFKTLSVINEAESKKKGRPVYDDQEVCEIRFSGNKQTVGVFPAHEQSEWAEDPVTNERVRITYAQKYNDQYKKFKAGAAQAASGTPVEELPFLTQGKRLELKALNIYTAEALAALDGNNLKMLGMGGRELKNQAQAYLDNAAKGADLAAVLSENDELRRRLAELEGKSGKKAQRKGSTVPQVSQPEPESETEQEATDTTEEVDEEVVDEEAGEETTSENDGDVDPENPFADWEADDIKLWIADADPAFEIDGRWGKTTLAEKAKEVNDKIAAAKAGA
ncbi:hypothetical protein [Agrobacterium tumefaciens]|uniref:hypothetical protein n=1 Tax=Agrobacterium tumefaciens TaxID=358 RepID=UPI001574A618|nr:hypothetical protein [Agrobacterium tumefaciens]NTB01075.1 hypothetical protein [Agrobacterium tumefaciens]